MSYQTYVEINCDSPGCCNAFNCFNGTTATIVRQAASKKGWRQRLGKDWCPSCRIERGERPRNPRPATR